MKTIILIISIFCSMYLKAQNINCPPGSNMLAPELDKFVGTWRWKSGTDTLTIYLYKQNIPVVPGCNSPSIVGWHRYVKNGVLIEGTEQYAGTPYFNNSHATIVAGAEPDVSSVTEISGGSSEETKHKSFSITLKMTNSTYTNMSWKIRNSYGLQPQDFDYGSTLPWNLILTKL